MGALTATATATVAASSKDTSSPTKTGLLYVGARFTNPDLPYPDFARWYDDIHMPHLASMKNCRSAMRYARLTEPSVGGREVTQSSTMPYATFYPLHDVRWLHSEEFDSAKDSTEADYLPGRSVFKSVEFDGRGYEFVGGSEAMGGREGREATKFIVFTTYEPHEGPSARKDEECMEKFYGAVEAIPGWRGTTRYMFCDVQRPEMAANFEARGQWPARDAVVHGLDVEKGNLDSVYRARDEAAAQLSDPSRLDVAIYELVIGLDGCP